jgi:hypothetical protein
MEDECYICLEPIKNNIAILNCGHKYHFDCISQWIKKKNDYRHICVVCGDKETEIISLKNISEKNKEENVSKSVFDAFYCCNIL